MGERRGHLGPQARSRRRLVGDEPAARLDPREGAAVEHGRVRGAVHRRGAQAQLALREAVERPGGPEYLSPEQITLRGHGRGVDWWASGVFLYELLVGFTPFCFENKDLNPTIIYQNILNPKYEIEYPSRLSSEVVHLVSSLLRSKPMERVGCLSGGPADIRKHVFFQKDDFDWGKLLRLELPPPYVPKIKSETDVSNFDRIESKVDFFAGEPYDFSDARQWDVDF